METPRDAWRFDAACVWLPTAEEMSAIDRDAIRDAIPERALIENAGRALAARLHARWPEGRVAALAGSGHNGADALVALRTLRAWGRDVAAVRCGSGAPDPDVLAGWDIELRSPEDLDAVLAGASIVIDGILGTGLSSAPREPQAAIIARLNASDVTVVACDGPSGVDFTTGAVPGEAVRAELTVTFGWPKIGMLRFPGRELCGDIEAVEIGFPPPLEPPRARLITAAWAAGLLGRRGDDAHKGRAGYLTVVGGQPGMAGAVVLAARAAIRGGIGVARVVSAPENREIVQTSVPAAVFVPWDERGAVEEAVGSADAVAIGPGLGGAGARRELVETVLAAAGGRPCAVDADALNLFESDADALGVACRGPAVLTPHPGEMARLFGRSAGEVTADPFAAARELASRTEATVLLKGAPTSVATPDGALRVSPLASPALAAGGTGDVLAGLVGACLAAGLDAPDAATAALVVSGLATLASEDGVGHSAEDVPDRLPAARSRLDDIAPGALGGVLATIQAARGAS